MNSGAVAEHDAICGCYSQLGANAAMAGGTRLGPLACLAPGELLTAAKPILPRWNSHLVHLIPEKA